MSKLLSLSNSNSKNTSYNGTGSKENKNSEIIKKQIKVLINIRLEKYKVAMDL